MNRPRPRPLRPDRLRSIERPFGWIPFRLLASGLLARLGRDAKLLYFFLCLVADGKGISFYGDRRVELLLELSHGELEHAREELCRHDLLAFDGRVYQVLSLPDDVGRVDRAGRRAGRDPREGQRSGEGAETVGRILRRLGLGEEV